MTTTKDYLAPISEADPCGIDISYQPAFLELDSMILGKPETQFSEAVKPEWKLVLARCEDLMEVSKDLRVATIFVLVRLQTGGLQEMGKAVELLAGWIRTYWDSIFPRLDPTDKFDPLERMNILSALTSPIGTFGDSFRFIERLGEAPLAQSATMGKLSLKDILQTDSGKNESGTFAHSQAVAAAFLDTPVEQLLETRDGLKRAQTGVREISAFLHEIDVIDTAPDFSLLLDRLAIMEKQLVPYVKAESAASEEIGAVAVSAARTAEGIHTRSDVTSMIDLICAYYADHEPSSAVPLLLQRARRLVHAGFLEALEEIAPDSLNQARTAVGSSQPTP